MLQTTHRKVNIDLLGHNTLHKLSAGELPSFSKHSLKRVLITENTFIVVNYNNP